MARKAFLPGCAVPSYNPMLVEKTIEHLKSVYPDLSVIQKCCGKPTQAVGQADKFQERFGGLVADVKAVEADEVIMACQSCMKTLSTCQDYKTTSLWELLPTIGLPKELVGKAKDSDVVFSVHDSCSVRGYDGIHSGVRWILSELGYKWVDPERSHAKARCCGFGGMVVPANPEVAKKVMERRVADFDTKHIVVYCAACRKSMCDGGGQAWHILDLIFGPVIYSDSPLPVDTLASPMSAWKNRRKSRQTIKRVMK